MTYARSRLLLGVSCVGTFVVIVTTALAMDLPARLLPTAPDALGAEIGALAAFVGVYVLVQLPFDLLGGRVLARRAGRRHPGWRAFSGELARGAVAHGLVLLAALALVHAGGRAFGVAGSTAAVAVATLLLVGARDPIARAVGRLRSLPRQAIPASNDAAFSSRVVASDDEGFTGGISGLLRARTTVLPERWAREIGEPGLRMVVQRRAIAVQSGAWLRGRVAAMVFVIAGAALAAGLVGTQALGTVAGTVEISLWFTLWSFLGLLVLPTPSRAAVLAVDRALADSLPDAAARARSAAVLAQVDRMADDEPARATGIEAVFHPIPSLARRTGADAAPAWMPAWWDVARTAVYAGTAAGGLLGRAVHCNCGRPALWVWLPSA